jgi:2,4-dienoyl-CoA reductase-like NADH-dependent reductase (Old Yellow Enzyme family)
MSELFESTTINGMVLKNRFVRSATYEAMANSDGTVKEQLLQYMAELVQGGVGLVITGHSHVAREGQAGPRQMGAYSDAMIDGLQQLSAVVHAHGGVVAIQLAHAGNKGIGKNEHSALGPSGLLKEGLQTAAAMTVEDIKRTVQAFGDAADRSVKAGFDAIQIHSAHGYLLSQFLSPYYNKRDDGYGGTLENRAKFLLEVYAEIRRRVGKAFPVMVKINAEDFLEGGMTVEEMVKVAHLLEEQGMDAIEMSGGTFESGRLVPSRMGTAKSEKKEVYYRKAAGAFKREIKIPLILVGGFLSYPVAEEMVTSGGADYIALSRPLIREPHLVQRWANGDRRKATCISCNKCFSTLLMEEALHCPVEKQAAKTK